MRVSTRQAPFSVARLALAPAEQARVASGAMLATSYGVDVQQNGSRSFGIFSGGNRGDTLFETTFIAPQQGGWVDVAPSLPGDLHVLEGDGQTGWCVAPERAIAAATTLRTDPRWPGFRGLFGGEPGFLTHVTGQGALVLSCCGALDVIALQPGQFVTVDTGHVVAFADNIQVRLRQFEQGAAQSMKTGAGLVFDFAGPGRVLTQTRDPGNLLSWLRTNGVGIR